MQPANYRAQIAAYIQEQARPTDKWSHQPRLYALAVAIGANQPYDDDVLYAAAWLHDLGVFYGHRPAEPAALAAWDNTAYAVAQVPMLLNEFGFPAHKIPLVVEAIRTHQPSADPSTLEGVILRDADILEQLGAIGALRTICKIGRDTRFHTFADALAALQRSLDTLPTQIRLETTRQLAAPRIALLRDFLAAAHHEAAGQPL